MKLFSYIKPPDVGDIVGSWITPFVYQGSRQLKNDKKNPYSLILFLDWYRKLLWISAWPKTNKQTNKKQKTE